MPVPITRSAAPRRYLTDKVTYRTVKLYGRHVDLTALAEGEGLCHSYVTRIIAGERNPTASYMKKLADALGMRVDDLMDAIESRRKERMSENQRRMG